jgi:solute carrier family 25 S-adenosylmethionine transporter 26
VRYLEGARPNSAEAAVCGMIAGGTAAALTTPLDVVKTRVMLEARGTAGAGGGAAQSPGILSFPPRFLAILRNEGVRTLFSGWVPRTLHISAGGAVFLGIYDFAVNFGEERKSAEQDVVA